MLLVFLYQDVNGILEGGKHGQRYPIGNYLETMIINSKAASHVDSKTKL